MKKLIFIFLITYILFFSITQSKKEKENYIQDCYKSIIFQQENKCTEIEKSNKKCLDLFKSAILQSYPTREADNQFLTLYQNNYCIKNKNKQSMLSENQLEDLSLLNVSVNCFISGDEPPHYKCSQFESSKASIIFNKLQFLLFISAFILCSL
ncbi:hypothetical protein ACTA71_011671 [Dictyostelium dimigraforme]